MSISRLGKLILALAIGAASVIIIDSTPASSESFVPVPLCFKYSVDVRAPYNQGAQAGQCPSGFSYIPIFSGSAPSGLTGCVKPSTDVRAPYNNGTCPSGFEAINFYTDQYGGVPVCVKVSLDWRGIYPDWTCPSGFSLVTLVGGLT
jgi:hypothetical protein